MRYEKLLTSVARSCRISDLPDYIVEQERKVGVLEPFEVLNKVVVANSRDARIVLEAHRMYRRNELAPPKRPEINNFKTLRFNNITEEEIKNEADCELLGNEDVERCILVSRWDACSVPFSELKRVLAILTTL